MASKMTRDEIREIADNDRRAIVQHRNGPAIVIAGPGSGKTTILAERFVSLCEDDRCEPSRIVAVTFTNEAADQMKKKVAGKFGNNNVSDFRIGTLHSLAKGLLHKYSDRLNLPSKFRVVGRLQETLLLADANLELKSKGHKFWPSQKAYLTRFKAQKAFVPNLNTISGNPYKEGFATQEQFDECYSSLLNYYGSLDWYDVVALVVKLLQENNDILLEVTGEIDYLLVDEYQDLNRADHEFIRLLAQQARFLMVFADDDQSIYQTGRFANPGGVKDFKNVYPNAMIYPLSICWRCGSSILDAAWKLIDVNEDRMPERMPKKKPISNPDRGYGSFEIKPLKSEKAEIQEILKELQKELDSEHPPKDILVLFHSREIGRKYIRTMENNDLQIENLLEQAVRISPKALLLYEMLRLLTDESDNLAARYLLQEFFEQDVSWIAKVRQISRGLNVPLWQAVIESADTRQAITVWVDKLENLRQMDDIVEIMTELAEAMGVNDDLEVKKIIEWCKAEDRITIRKFIDRLKRGFDFDESPSTEPENAYTIRVMTIHGSKGIDADVVFVPAVEDELIPNQWYESEQRRLLYVAMTRVKRRLLLSWAWSRIGRATYRSPKRAEIKRERSRFLDDIERAKST